MKTLILFLLLTGCVSQTTSDDDTQLVAALRWTCHIITSEERAPGSWFRVGDEDVLYCARTEQEGELRTADYCRTAHAGLYCDINCDRVLNSIGLQKTCLLDLADLPEAP